MIQNVKVLANGHGEKSQTISISFWSIFFQKAGKNPGLKRALACLHRAFLGAHFYALLRALEIGLELDYKYMLIQSADSRPEITQSTLNLPTYTTTTGNVAGETFYANTMSSTPTNFTSRKPRYFLNVSFFTEMPEGKFLKDKLFEIQPDLVNLKIKIDDVKTKESTWHLKPGKSKNPAIPNVLRNR